MTTTVELAAGPETPAAATTLPPAAVRLDEPPGDHFKCFRRFVPDTPDGETFICYLGVGLQAEGAKNPARMLYLCWEGRDPDDFHNPEAAPDEPHLEIPYTFLAEYPLLDDFLAAVRARQALTLTDACDLLAGLGYADTTELLVWADAPGQPGCDRETYRLRTTATGEFTACSAVGDDDDLPEEAEELLPAVPLRFVTPGGVFTLTLAYTRPELRNNLFGVLVHDGDGRFVRACDLSGRTSREYNAEYDWRPCVTVPRCVHAAVVNGWSSGATRVEAA